MFLGVEVACVGDVGWGPPEVIAASSRAGEEGEADTGGPGEVTADQ